MDLLAMTMYWIQWNLVKLTKKNTDFIPTLTEFSFCRILVAVALVLYYNQGFYGQWALRGEEQESGEIGGNLVY